MNRTFHEYLYDFEIDGANPEVFSERIQREVEQFGGCVINSRHEGPSDDGKSKVTVAFDDREALESFIRDYYTDGGLEEEDIKNEILLIRET
jgi:hypothetical protein